jgi:non-homologous end joining protein Ku
VRNQHYCPVCSIVVERADLVRSFQHAKDKYVPIVEEELENLEAEANKSIDLKSMAKIHVKQNKLTQVALFVYDSLNHSPGIVKLSVSSSSE